MKKYIIILFTILLSACSEQKDENIIKFATCSDYPPFEYQENGELRGFDVELAKLIGKHLNKEVVFENMQFSSILPSLQESRVDAAIATIAITKERLQAFDFSIPYYFDKIVAVFKTENPINDKRDLIGKKIACQLGTVMQIWLKTNIPEAEIILLNNNNQAIESLKAGHVDIVIIDAAQGAVFSNKNSNLSFINIAEANEGYGIALKQGSSLKSQIDEAIKALQENGELQKLQNQWIEKWKH